MPSTPHPFSIEIHNSFQNIQSPLIGPYPESFIPIHTFYFSKFYSQHICWIFDENSNFIPISFILSKSLFPNNHDIQIKLFSTYSSVFKSNIYLTIVCFFPLNSLMKWYAGLPTPLFSAAPLNFHCTYLDNTSVCDR